LPQVQALGTSLLTLAALFQVFNGTQRAALAADLPWLDAVLAR
jgi:hypothetical protein